MSRRREREKEREWCDDLCVILSRLNEINVHGLKYYMAKMTRRDFKWTINGVFAPRQNKWLIDRLSGESTDADTKWVSRFSKIWEKDKMPCIQVYKAFAVRVNKRYGLSADRREL